MIPDFSALCAPEILKTFGIRSFFYEKWLLPHVFGGSCILRSPADSDAFQSGRYAEHNGRSKTLDFIV